MPTVDDLRLRDFVPRPSATLAVTSVDRPRFPVIDAHNHLGELRPGLRFSGRWPDRPVSELLDTMAAAGVVGLVDLDGQTGDALRRELDRYGDRARFRVFAGVDYDAIATRRDFGSELARQLRSHVAAGAAGLKVWKPLGLTVRDVDGHLVAPDDPRLAELWATAGELGVPVLIHVADPVAFFDPLNVHNERYEELSAHPDWHFHGPGFPPFATVIEQLATIVRRHRRTTFIGAHVGCYAENLPWVSRLLDECPNFHVDISARLGELGRVPYSARDLLVRHADRVLFGTDSPPDVATYRLHYRFLESRDEFFHYTRSERPPQGRWMIYGLHLPDDVLRRVYHDNAARLLGFAPLGREVPGHGPGPEQPPDLRPVQAGV